MKVDRISATAGDYGTLSAQARDRCMAANILSFRRFQPDQVRDAYLLVVRAELGRRYSRPLAAGLPGRQSA